MRVSSLTSNRTYLNYLLIYCKTSMLQNQHTILSEEDNFKHNISFENQF